MDATPSQTVFAIPELLEHVLSYSTAKDLIRFQLVSTLWHRTIQDSRPIHRALYLEAIPATTVWLLDDRNLDKVTVKATLASSPHPPLPPAPPSPIHLEVDPNFKWKTILQGTFNPLLLRRGYFDRYPNFTERLRLGECVVVLYPRTPLPESARRMYLTQPPCTELKLWMDFKAPATLRNPKGLTAGDLLMQTERAPIVPYMEHMFVQVMGFIEPTEKEESEDVPLLLREGGEEAVVEETVEDTTS